MTRYSQTVAHDLERLFHAANGYTLQQWRVLARVLYEGHIWKTEISLRAGKQCYGCPVCVGRVNQNKNLIYKKISSMKSPTKG